MALNEAECQKCRVELDKLLTAYAGAGDVPEVALARLTELDAALEGECSGSSDDSSDAGAGVVVAGVVVAAGVIGSVLLAALFGSRQ